MNKNFVLLLATLLGCFSALQSVTSTFLDAVLISMATARQTAAKDSALLVAVDWARVWRTFSHHGDTALSRDCDVELSLGKAPVDNNGIWIVALSDHAIVKKNVTKPIGG